MMMVRRYFINYEPCRFSMGNDHRACTVESFPYMPNVLLRTCSSSVGNSAMLHIAEGDLKADRWKIITHKTGTTSVQIEFFFPLWGCCFVPLGRRVPVPFSVRDCGRFHGTPFSRRVDRAGRSPEILENMIAPGLRNKNLRTSRCEWVDRAVT